MKTAMDATATIRNTESWQEPPKLQRQRAMWFHPGPHHQPVLILKRFSDPKDLKTSPLG